MKNNVKKILIVSIAAPPYTNPESLQFSKYLKYLTSANFKLFLITAKISRKNLGWRKVDNRYKPILDECEQVIEIPIYYNSVISGMIKRLWPRWYNKPDNERWFISGWKKVIRKLNIKPDLIYSRSSPISSTIMAMKLQKFYQVPWIMHLSDPWTLSPLFNLNGKERGYHTLMESNCISTATKICLTSKTQIDLYEQHYPRFKCKFEWFPNVYDDSEVSSIEPDYAEKLTFVHTGNFYGERRSPLPFLKAIEAVHKQQPGCLMKTEFLFAGFQDDAITKIMLEYEKYGVYYLGPLTREECYKLYAKASILVIVDLDLPAEESVFFPSKTLDYMTVRKPILAITTPGSTLFNVVDKVYGRCFGHSDVTGIKDYIFEMIYKHQSGDSIFHSPYQLDEKYSAKYNAQRLAKLIGDSIEMPDEEDST